MEFEIYSAAKVPDSLLKMHYYNIKSIWGYVLKKANQNQNDLHI